MTTNQELDIIARMRSEIHSRKKDTGVNLFLVWGYPTAVVFLLEFVVLLFLQKHWYEWLWAGIPLLGVPLMKFFVKKDYDRTGHRTHEAHVALYLWFFIGAASAILGFTTGITGVYPICYCIIQGLLIGMGGFLTGVISRFRPMTVGGIIGSVVTFACLFLHGDLWPWQFLVTAIVTVMTLIIPGHLYKQYVNNYGI